MRRYAAICAAVLLVLAVGAARAEARAQKRVLMVSEARGFVHDSIPAAVEFFELLGRRSDRYDIVHLERGAAALTADRLRRADAVVFANTSGELPLPDRRALVRFVRRGGGFVGTHSASDTLHDWPAYARLLGGEFASHPPPLTATLTVEGGGHPATRGLPASFELHEEYYDFVSPPRARILITREGRPLVWSRRHGQGRVFYDALGHFTETWTNPLHRRLLRHGLAWVLSGEGAPAASR
jgi:type 1 glutamine amidotransferase